MIGTASSAFLVAACAAVLPSLARAQDPGADATSSIVVTKEQVDAVERGLAWLAAKQVRQEGSPNDGSWISKIGYKLNNDYRWTADDKGHLAVTALACMAFLAGGNSPGRGRYGAEVERGLAFVLRCVNDDGYIAYAGSRMYDHAFATLFLAEVFGMTHDADV